jgi:phage gpG-like protein
VIEITGKIVGAANVRLRLLSAGPRVRAAVEREVRRITIDLQRRVKEKKLSGQVLNVRSGRLRRSINQRVRVLGDSIRGTVGTNVNYGAAWERGFTVPERDIFPKDKKALFWPGARHPVAHVHQAERKEAARPFLVPSLDEMRVEIPRRILRAAFAAV